MSAICLSCSDTGTIPRLRGYGECWTASTPSPTHLPCSCARRWLAGCHAFDALETVGATPRRTPGSTDVSAPYAAMLDTGHEHGPGIHGGQYIAGPSEYPGLVRLVTVTRRGEFYAEILHAV